MNLTIFGANGPTGRLLTRLAIDAGHRVVAVTRHPDASRSGIRSCAS